MLDRTRGRLFLRALAIGLVVSLGAACAKSEDPLGKAPVPSFSPSSTSPSPSPTVAPAPPTSSVLAGTRPNAVITTSGIVAPVMSQVPEGVVVGTPCGRTTVVREGIPLGPSTVVLDPGHGGSETGSVGANGLIEKDLNLVVSRFTAEALQSSGQQVVLTRSSDYRITLQARAAIAKALQPRAFVSIHHNGDPDGPHPGPGTETFYQVRGSSAAESKRLAGLIYEEVVKALSAFQPMAWTADRDAGAKYRLGSSGDDYYGILRHSRGIPTVISEAAFLSSPPEAELLSRPEVQRAEGQAIARAIVRFVTTSDQGSGFVEPYTRTQPAGGGGGSSDCTDPPM